MQAESSDLYRAAAVCCYTVQDLNPSFLWLLVDGLCDQSAQSHNPISLVISLLRTDFAHDSQSKGIKLRG